MNELIIDLRGVNGNKFVRPEDVKYFHGGKEITWEEYKELAIATEQSTVIKRK